MLGPSRGGVCNSEESVKERVKQWKRGRKSEEANEAVRCNANIQTELPKSFTFRGGIRAGTGFRLSFCGRCWLC